MLNTTPPRTHDLDLLADLIEANVSPLDIREASLILTQYAVDARYPGTDIDEEEAKEAIFHAESIHNWAIRVLQPPSRSTYPSDPPTPQGRTLLKARLSRRVLITRFLETPLKDRVGIVKSFASMTSHWKTCCIPR